MNPRLEMQILYMKNNVEDLRTQGNCTKEKVSHFAAASACTSENYKISVQEECWNPKKDPCSIAMDC